MFTESVWVIAPDYGYDGLGEPSNAFRTKSEAEAFLAAVVRMPGAPLVRLMEVPFWDTAVQDFQAPLRAAAGLSK
jgi:hypothetical protein